MNLIDLTGKQFGRWTVIAPAHSRPQGGAIWLCRCVCGTERGVRGDILRNGQSTGCGRCASRSHARNGESPSASHIRRRKRPKKSLLELLQNPNNRKGLTIHQRPYFVSVVPRLISLGYRRNEGCGSWTVRKANGNSTSWTEQIGLADDQGEADGKTVFSFAQAFSLAYTRGQGEPDYGDRITVANALDEYETALRRNGQPAARAVSTVRNRLPKALLNKEVAQLTRRELARFRDSIQGVKSSTVNTLFITFKAALNRVPDKKALANKDAWDSLKPLPEEHESRNVILTNAQEKALVKAAYEESYEFGLFVEVGAVTGSRPIQISQLKVQDLQADQLRVMMPSSQKGRGRKISQIEVPITIGLANRLREIAGSRPGNELLLLRHPLTHPQAKQLGSWMTKLPKSEFYRYPFQRAVVKAGLDPKVVTYYALRHSSIVRLLVAKESPRLVAAMHDTSLAMIQRHYSRDIASLNEMMRPSLLNIDEPDEKVAIFRR